VLDVTSTSPLFVYCLSCPLFVIGQVIRGGSLLWLRFKLWQGGRWAPRATLAVIRSRWFLVYGVYRLKVLQAPAASSSCARQCLALQNAVARFTKLKHSRMCVASNFDS
jgi:hypothetical protein